MYANLRSAEDGLIILLEIRRIYLADSSVETSHVRKHYEFIWFLHSSRLLHTYCTGRVHLIRFIYRRTNVVLLELCAEILSQTKTHTHTHTQTDAFTYDRIRARVCVY